MSRRKSAAEVEIEAQLGGLDPSSERFRVLLAARNFKASWIEFGELLTEVRERRVFEKWGHSSFEAYARRELRLRQDTAQKLTRSFSYLREHEPKAIDEREGKDLPPLDVVDLLSRAGDSTKLSDQEIQGIHQQVFDGDLKATRNGVVRKIRELDPDAFRKAAATLPGDGDIKPADVRKALMMAERLEALLGDPFPVSSSTRVSVNSLVQELRSVFEKMTEEDGAQLRVAS